MEARGIDVSEGRIGLLTAWHFQPKQIMEFDEKLCNRIGIVAWGCSQFPEDAERPLISSGHSQITPGRIF